MIVPVLDEVLQSDAPPVRSRGTSKVKCIFPVFSYKPRGSRERIGFGSQGRLVFDSPNLPSHVGIVPPGEAARKQSTRIDESIEI
jgi:hypothetical protein